MSLPINAIRQLTIFFMVFFMIASSVGQQSEYQRPVKEIAELVDAPRTPHIEVSPDQQWLLIMKLPGLPSIAELAQPELRLAGLRLNPNTNGPSRSEYYSEIIIQHLFNDKLIPITGLPDGARIGNVAWSPDSRQIAFTITTDNGIELWIAEVGSGKARQILPAVLNAAYYNLPYEWEPSGRSLLCKRVLESRGSPPQPPRVPMGPIIQENVGKTAAAPTFQDLLKNPHDEALFEYYLTAQLIRVDLQGQITPLAKAGMIQNASPSPDGKYILISYIQRPFSYLVPAYRFPQRVEIIDANGKLVKILAELPLAEDVPIGRDAVRKGPRSFGWRQDAPATVYWVEAQDDGDPTKNVPVRDKIWLLPAPFDRDATMLCNLTLRFGSVYWADDKLALVSESWWKTRQERLWAVNPSAPQKQLNLLFDLSSEDRYRHPGSPLLRKLANGKLILRRNPQGNAIYLHGQGASPQGNFPFLDEYQLTTGQSKRLWQCKPPYYETVVDLLAEDASLLLTRREANDEPPNYHLWDLKKNTSKQVTHFPHPYPQLKNIKKELIRYKRNDGVELTATLYLPPDYEKDKKLLPVLMWAYPQEFKSADFAGQVTDSPYRFLRIHWASPLFWLVRGYAILDDPAMPIVGEKDQEPNDTYIEQLVASAQAAVDELVRRGIADPERIAIGGHSYGAFMVANLLSHCDLFKTGIARSGAYNRTLTPFGFQAEERTLWQAKETYMKMSPFLYADSLRAPILLIHGEADNNTGTFPMQSERYFNALKGLGKTARLVILPLESHGYRARESVMHMLWEMDTWLERWLK